ncbi:MAG: hypothetical protein ACF8XB_23680, partial [Planctomycetota bacterium JB042]
MAWTPGTRRSLGWIVVGLALGCSEEREPLMPSTFDERFEKLDWAGREIEHEVLLKLEETFIGRGQSRSAVAVRDAAE